MLSLSIIKNLKILNITTTTTIYPEESHKWNLRKVKYTQILPLLYKNRESIFDKRFDIYIYKSIIVTLIEIKKIY